MTSILTRTLTLMFVLTFSFVSAQTIDNFAAPGTFGGQVELNSYKNSKAVVVIFTGNHCVYSKKYIDRIIALENATKGLGVQFIMVNSNDEQLSPQESMGAMKTLVDSKGISFPYVKDADKSIAEKFGATKNPDAYVLKPAGEAWTVAYHGLIDDNALMPARVQNKYLEDAIKAIAGGGQATTAETEPVGCTIK